MWPTLHPPAQRRKTSNSAWSLAAHACPCPSSCGRQGQGQLKVSAPTLAMVLILHGGRRWPRDPPSSTGPQQGLSGWSPSSPPGSAAEGLLQAQGHTWTWLSSHNGNCTGTLPGHLLPALHRGSGVPALASPLPTAPEGDPELLPRARASLEVPTTPHPPWDPQCQPSPLPSTDTMPVSPPGTWGHCNPSTKQSGASWGEARAW